MNQSRHKELAKNLKDLIDGCSFGTVKRYFLDPSTDIDQIYLVTKGHQLHEVTASFINLPKGKETEHLFKALTAGVVKCCVNDLRKVKRNMMAYSLSLDLIPMIQPVAFFTCLLHISCSCRMIVGIKFLCA